MPVGEVKRKLRIGDQFRETHGLHGEVLYHLVRHDADELLLTGDPLDIHMDHPLVGEDQLVPDSLIAVHDLLALDQHSIDVLVHIAGVDLCEIEIPIGIEIESHDIGLRIVETLFVLNRISGFHGSPEMSRVRRTAETIRRSRHDGMQVLRYLRPDRGGFRSPTPAVRGGTGEDRQLQGGTREGVGAHRQVSEPSILMADKGQLRPDRLREGQLLRDGGESSEIQSFRIEDAGDPMDIHGVQLGLRAIHQ